ncbi:MAG: hypothetical protein M1821_003669 [Bathelium mastoideum]|nr:MAG: hypothetical protein M1821_003669 [Bathelium mastoideum]
MACLGTLLVSTLGVARWTMKRFGDRRVIIAMPRIFRTLTTAFTVFLAYITLRPDQEALKVLPISFLLASSIAIGTWMGLVSATSHKSIEISDEFGTLAKGFLVLIGYLACHDLDSPAMLTALCLPLSIAMGAGAWMAVNDASKPDILNPDASTPNVQKRSAPGYSVFRGIPTWQPVAHV